jgi:hypothetical protein
MKSLRYLRMRFIAVTKDSSIVWLGNVLGNESAHQLNDVSTWATFAGNLISTEVEKFRRQTLPNVKSPSAHG